ncbi:MAG: MATE family efflux transporter, partial [Clostridia bacterium]|nr:MATE family efflux transporter [Clostridia bacterium]
MFSHKRVDATQGAIIPTMLKYAFPLMLTTLVQGLFNAVDIAVLGQMASPTDVASVGATSTIATLLVNLFVGISSGVKILIARYIGANNRRKAQDTVNTAVISSV